MDGPMYRQSLSPPKLSQIANIKTPIQHPHRGNARLRVHSAGERGNNERTIRLCAMTAGLSANPTPHSRQQPMASSLERPQYAQFFIPQPPASANSPGSQSA
jgi:hypothetical protein